MKGKKGNNWELYLGKSIRLIIEDVPFPRPKDGILDSIDDIHVWLIIEGKELPVPFLKNSIKRMELKENKEYGTNQI